MAHIMSYVSQNPELREIGASFVSQFIPTKYVLIIFVSSKIIIEY